MDLVERVRSALEELHEGFRSRKGQKAQSALRDALITTVAEVGLEGVAVANLCCVAGLKRTSFYTHFTTLEDFVDGIADQEFSRFRCLMQAKILEDVPGLGALVALILEIHAMHSSRQTWPTFVARLLAEHESTRARLRSDIATYVRNAVRAGDLQMPSNLSEAFVQLTFASVETGLIWEGRRPACLVSGRDVCELLLQAGSSSKSLDDLMLLDRHLAT